MPSFYQDTVAGLSSVATVPVGEQLFHPKPPAARQELPAHTSVHVLPRQLRQDHSQKPLTEEQIPGYPASPATDRTSHRF